jgi:hypothetical protein
LSAAIAPRSDFSMRSSRFVAVGITVSVTLVPGGGLVVSGMVAEPSEYCGSGVAALGI